MDTPIVQTGFGRASREILTRLNNTEKYDIVVLGLNDRGEYDELRKEFKIIPCPDLKDDPYGYGMMGHVLQSEKPNVLLALNDIWVFTGFKENNNVDWFRKTVNGAAPGLPVVCYFTIDGKPNAPEWDEFIQWLTVPIVMSDYGEMTVLETCPEVKDRLKKAYHGSSVEYFYPIPDDERKKARAELSKGQLQDDDFLIVAVSRNQPRKNIPTLLHAFKKFSDGYHICPKCGYPNSNVDTYCEICWTPRDEVTKGEFVEGRHDAYLYLHMNLRDARGYKLDKLIRDNRMGNLFYRQNHNIARGVSIKDLNRIYNAGDVFCQPTFAEGYGLPPMEAACAGSAVIATHSTTMVEMFKDGRGELVLPDSVYVLADAGHCRKHHISEKGLIDAFEKLYKDKELRKSYGEKARQFALTRTWDDSAKVIDEALQYAASKVVQIDELFKGSSNDKFLVVNTDINPEHIIYTASLIKTLKKKFDGSEIITIVNDKYTDLFDNLDYIDGVTGSRYGVGNKAKMQNKKINTVNITGLWDKYISAVFPRVEMDVAEFYCSKFGLNASKKIQFRVSKEEKEWAKNFIEEKCDGKIPIFVGTSGTEDNLYPFVSWVKVLEYLSKMKKVYAFTDLVESACSESEKTTSVSELTMRQQVIISRACKILVSCDNIFLLLADSSDNLKIGISAGRDLKNKYEFDNFTEVSRHTDEFQNCWPCNRFSEVPCKANGAKESACAARISPEEIMGVISKAVMEVQ